MEGKLDALIIQLSEHIKKDEAAWDKLSKLEKKLMYATGAVSVVIFFVSSVIAAAYNKLVG